MSKFNLEQLNSFSPYLTFEIVADGIYEWTYCCTSCYDFETEDLMTLEDCVTSYIKWSAKQLEPENFMDMEEDE